MEGEKLDGKQGFLTGHPAKTPAWSGCRPAGIAYHGDGCREANCAVYLKMIHWLHSVPRQPAV